MSMDNIRKANKKRQHELKRKLVRTKRAGERDKLNTRNRKIRKMMVEGRREQLKRQAAGRKYVEELETELAN